jgi:L-threonine kinase
MGAVLYALAAACERPLTSQQASFLATQIEPSDSTLFPGLAMFNHIEGTFAEALPSTPPLVVLVIDPGRSVDTVAYNRQNYQTVLDELAPTHQIAFSLLRQGLLFQDWAMVGKAATISATAHQKILFNPLLNNILDLAKSVSALGVCRAHSGSLLGLLLDPAIMDADAICDHVRSRLPSTVKTTITTLVDGGPRYNISHTDYAWSSPSDYGVAPEYVRQEDTSSRKGVLYI